jgi:hypothetical protein
MPFVTIPTVAAGSILSAGYLNSLSDNQEFLYGLANQANIPFNSFAMSDQNFNADSAYWIMRHRNRYLHYKVTGETGWEYARIFMNGVKIAGQEGGAVTLSGYFDLTSWAGLPNLVGAWASGVAYDETKYDSGDNGDNDDGSVVTSGGQYYRCKNDHTSSAATQPGVGASWATMWDLLVLPVIGGLYSLYASVNYTSTPKVTTVHYFLESDSTII